jgi:arginase
VKRKNSKTVNLIGFPMDLGADRRGVDMGPSALRIAGLPEQLQNLGYKLIDDGDIVIQIKKAKKLKILNSNILARY